MPESSGDLELSRAGAGGSTEAGTAAGPDADASRRPDMLAGSLEIIAGLLGQPFSAESYAHLPLADGLTLDLALLPRAAETLGLETRLVALKPSEVSGLVLPVIVLLDRGEACVLAGIDPARGACEIIVPPVPGDRRTMWVGELDARSTGHVIYISRRAGDPVVADAPAEAATGRRSHWLAAELARHWPAWLQIALAAAVINLLGLAFPLFTMNVYDRVIPNVALPTLWSLTGGVLVAVLFEFLLRQLRAVVLDDLGGRVDMRVSARLFEHALAISMAERRESSGSIAHRLKEFESSRDFFTSASLIAVIDFLFVGLFVWVLWLIVGPIALVPLLALVMVVVATLLLQIPLGRAVGRAQRHASGRHATLIESLGGIEAIKAVGGEAVMQRRWEGAIAAHAKAGAGVRFWSQIALHFTAMVQQAVGIAIIVWGVYLVADGAITVGGLIAASILAGRALAPLSSIAMTIARAQQAFAAMRGVTQLLALKRDGDGPVVVGQQVERGEIELRDVGFAYPGRDRDVLAGLNLKIAPGERVGIVGRVGSGKTTIGKLLAGFYEPARGAVLVDGFDTRSYHPAALRLGVGFLGQEAELFTGTLSENIALGLPGAPAREIEIAARAAGVEAFASHSPHGLAMQVGERGRFLSGGQKQAVAIARILLRRPKVLVLDEPSSAMDMNTEAELLRRLGDWLSPDQTLIVFSHRLPMLELASRLIVLDSGRIAADGPRAKVLAALGASQPAASAPGGAR